MALIFNIQRFSVNDGPGIRTNVFFKGCPLNCLWCHNPESKSTKPDLGFIASKCIGCGHCLTQCPGHCHTMENGEHVIDRSKCLACRACERFCAGALEIMGREMTVDEVLGEVMKDEIFYKTSNGGMTVSGGEPLSQIDFTVNLLAALKKAGIHTALDTTMYASWDRVERTIPYTDLYLIDIKHMDSHDHETVVGVPNEQILANTLKLAQSGAHIRVRVPTIPNFNDSDKNFIALGEFAKKLGSSLTEIQVLPYHSLGVAKWARIKHKNKVFVADNIPDERVDHLADLLRGMDLPVVIH